MQELLAKLDVPDFEFIFEIVRGRFSFTSDKRLRAAIDAFVGDPSSSERLNELCELFEHEMRYLGSSDIAYVYRRLLKRQRTPGVPFREIVLDVYGKLKQQPPQGLRTDEELLEKLVRVYASSRIQKLPINELRALLQSVGVSAGDASRYLKENATRFAIPALIQIAGVAATRRVVTNAVIGTITQYVGRQTARSLFTSLAARFPIWAEWLGPIAWSITGLWTAYDLQGPAARKTVPLTLYIGLCMLRDGGLETTDN